MIMTVNNTCVHGNETTCLAPSSSSTGLAVGLTFFFILLLSVAGAIVYKYHSKMRSMLQFRQRRSHTKKQDYTETPPEDSHQYVSTIGEQSTGQNPIYENLTTRTTGYKKPALNRLPSETEEDVYLQCDSPDDAIYGNDPACNLSILPDSQEEDVYIMPDS
ncbi:hypothetical protein VZT92_004161 [Zoarces viviparus]|uniref:Uncharacterized protein n=1 Tax=Zoarces viviparus TaxID=48416 RepID=A0AAW1FVS6_ZOAVI